MTFLRKYGSLILIIFLAAALRINLLFVRGNWWFDEMFSVHYSTLPWGEAIKYWLLETNPFLYNLVLRAWIYCFGQGETTVRIPSVFFGLLTIILVYQMAQKLISKRAATISSLIISLSGIHLFISTETRTYALFVLLTTISFYLFIKIFIEQKTNRTLWFFYFLTQLFLLYSHLTALTIVIIQFLLLAYFKNTDKSTRRNFIWTQATALFFWCFWLIPTMIPKLTTNSFSGWFFTYDTDSSNLLTIFNTLFINANISEFTFTLFSIILIGLIFYLFKNFPQQEKQRKDILIILMLWSFLPPVFGAFLGQYVTKYFVFSLPAFAILLAYTLDSVADKTARLALTTIFLALFIPSTFTIATNPVFSITNVMEYVKSNETERSKILVMPFNEELVLKKYFKGNSNVEGIYFNDDNLKLEERIVRYNWQTLMSPEKEYEKWMGEHTKNNDKIFLLQYDNIIGPVSIWLSNNGWIFKKEVKTKGHIGLTMYEFWSPQYNTERSSTSTPKN